ncbi:MAG: hypothetical protein ABIH85_06840 [Candidatus Omnitrophota bacterium]|nr:hypothetical protein [Candidatus Omnitrophota bacterium]MBU1894287.1 hypothetical protein [Candidatus Omnitrophota bacterium]
MISKQRLLSGINEMKYVEESMVTFFANFSKAVVNETDGLSEEIKNNIQRRLTRLYQDSFRHGEIIERMADRIEKEEKNEY